MTFALQVRNSRRSLDLTQVELAAAIGCTAQTVSNWETGMAVPWPKQQAAVLGRLLDMLQNAPAAGAQTRIIDRI